MFQVSWGSFAHVIDNFPPEARTLGYSSKDGAYRRFRLTAAIVRQSLAVQIRVTGRQVRSTENDPKPRSLSEAVNESRTAI